MNDLYKKNIGLAYYYANQFKGYLKIQNTLELDDLINVCLESLYESSLRFDESKNVKFANFATAYMKFAMHDCINGNSHTIKLTSNIVGQKKKIDKLLSENDITIDELEKFGIKDYEVRTYNMVRTQAVDFQDINIVDEDTESDGEISHKQLIEDLVKYIDMLEPDEQYFIKGYWALDGCRKFKMDVMTDLKLNRRQFERMHKKILEKLKEWMSK